MHTEPNALSSTQDRKLTPPSPFLLHAQGGFSYVYLVQDTSTSELLALKKIRCPFGAESVAQAMREVEAYRLFAHSPGVICSVGYSIATERGADEGAKTVYVLLPYYRRGNLQDLINANLVNHARFPDRRLMQLFLGVCRALRDMHVYTGAGPGPAPTAADGPAERMAMRPDGADMDPGGGGGRAKRGKKPERKAVRPSAGADEDDESEQQRPLMAGEDGGAHGGGGGPSGEIRSYAHRDIKPGTVSCLPSSTSPPLPHHRTKG